MGTISLTISIKKLLLLGSALVLTAASAMALAAMPAGASGSGSKTIVVINKSENVQPTSLGFVFNSPVYKPTTDQVVGSDSGACELLPPRDGITDEYLCDTVFEFPNGTITATGRQLLSSPNALGAVTGGTGEYLGCEGTVIGELHTATPEPQDFKITVKLTECW